MTSPPPLPNNVKRSSPFKIIGLGVLFSLTALYVIGEISLTIKDNAEKSTPTCKSDWSKCASNDDMMRLYEGTSRVQVACQSAADKLAKYGTPEWPWLSFSSLYRGTDYATKGIMTVVEPDAKFQNGFGAMVRSKVVCSYDLRTQKVIDVSVQ